MTAHKVQFSLSGKDVTLETGVMAKQADGAVLVSSGDNRVLVTVVSKKEASNMDFFPLTVEYQEKYYSSGRIPGGFLKREGRPSQGAILQCRLMDRPLRPLFPEGYRYETQIVATILSYDGQDCIGSLATIGASAALHVSDIPFAGPLASVQVSRTKGEYALNPSVERSAAADLSFLVAGTRKGLTMVEGESSFVSEADVLQSLKEAHAQMEPIFKAQDELREKAGKAKRPVPAPKEIDAAFSKKAEDFLKPGLKECLKVQEKLERYDSYSKLLSEAKEALLDEQADNLAEQTKDLQSIFENLKYTLARQKILSESRIDGRSTTDIRNISCQAALLPRAHGSALFTRGETQVLGVVTLGTEDDEQLIDNLDGSSRLNFMLHYNFPPYSVAEVGRFGGQSRREVGHGVLAERALAAALPGKEAFPYTIRVTSEVLESNGSSSMGTVCSGTMALLDAGVPIKENISGIAMGLIKEGDQVAILSDILGDEDHLGDMDFKVAGGRGGITALQMDIKIDSLSFELLEKSLEQARQGREHILDEMEKTIKSPKSSISQYAPKVYEVKVRPEKVRDVIGSGGKNIRAITSESNAKINVSDDGTIQISTSDPRSAEIAKKKILELTEEAKVGNTYQGMVKKITDFGAFVEVLPNSVGLLHISEIDHKRIRTVSDVLKEGEKVDVKVLDVDRFGKIKLSRKALLDAE